MKNKKVTVLDLIPREASVVSLIGKSRVFADKKRRRQTDKVGRKAKHKGRTD